MKKILAMLFMAILNCVFISSVFGANPIKNYNSYSIIGERVEKVVPLMDNLVIGQKGVRRISGVENAYYLTYSNEHYYIRFYPANTNTDVYIVSDGEYDKYSNAMTVFFKNNNFKYILTTDRDALREYKFDFIDCARAGMLDGLFIMPDYIKPLKTGLGKINDKISKNSKKNSAIPYSNDLEPVDLPLINTQSCYYENAKLNITVNEYRLKNKENKYVHAFEYVLENKDSSSIVVDKVTSERVAGMKDVTTQTYIDLDKVDMMGKVGAFPPVVICTGGVSALFAIPNWVRLAKVTKESVKYAKTLPENYTLEGNSTMKILVMKFKNAPKPLDFTLKRSGQTYKFSL